MRKCQLLQRKLSINNCGSAHWTLSEGAGPFPVEHCGKSVWIRAGFLECWIDIHVCTIRVQDISHNHYPTVEQLTREKNKEWETHIRITFCVNSHLMGWFFWIGNVCELDQTKIKFDSSLINWKGTNFRTVKFKCELILITQLRQTLRCKQMFYRWVVSFMRDLQFVSHLVDAE